MIDWQKLTRHRLLDIAAILLAFLGVWRIAIILPHSSRTNDFAHYYLSSRLLVEGENPYTTSLAPLYARYGFEFNADVPTATNPPSLIWLFIPFAILPYPMSFSLWVGVQVLSLGMILWMTRNLMGDRISCRGWLYICSITLAASPVYWHFAYSQAQLMLAALILGGYYLRVSGRQSAACVVVTIAGLIKLFPFVMLPWFLWGRERRWEIRRTIVAAITVVLVLLVTNPSLWLDFFTHTPAVLSNCAINHTFVFSLPSLVVNWGRANAAFQSTSANAHLWDLAGAMAGLVLIALLYAACRRKGVSEESQFLLLTIAMMAGTITTRGHYLVFLIFPVAMAALWIWQHGTTRRYLFLAAVLLGLNTIGTVENPFLNQHLHLKIILNYIPLYAMLALAAWVTFKEDRHGARSDDSDWNVRSRRVM